MYKLKEEDGCMCRPGHDKGVVPVSFTANDNLEVWASCDDKDATAYEFGCNHVLVPEGDTVSLPLEPISEYNKSEGLHLHVRARSKTPHSPSKNIKWSTVPLKSCTCVSHGVNTTTDDRDALGKAISEDRFDHLFQQTH